MKQIYSFIISLSIFSICCSCDSAYVSHPNVGKHVFETIQTLDTLPAEKFRSLFISYEELLKMIQNTKEGEKLIPQLAEISAEQYYQDIDSIYSFLKQDAKDNSIGWKNTAFEKYDYKTTRNRSMTLNHGTIHFLHNKKQFELEVYWITDLTVSGLLGVGGLQATE
ncbi:hypothetical protein [Kordia zhangzhouensis]|uniref:hypothetical protein n=1 Tax=Kordia zhangzhouensis TaxID=1620405 RepID=UPI0006292440|nr:hypothetical protein [Kordia zhangzhouensis]